MSFGDSLGSLFVHLRGDSSALTETLVKARGEVGVFAAEVKAENAGVGASMSAMSNVLIGVSLAVVGGMAAMTESVMNNGEQLYRLRAVTGMTGEQLSGLTLIANRAGVEGGQLQMMLGRLSLNAQNAGKGFKTLGIDTRDAHGEIKPLNTLLGEVADKFKVMPDGPTKTAVALELFSRAGTKMIPVLNQGSKAFVEAQQEADRLGVTLNDSTIDAMHKLFLEQKQMDEAWKGLTVTVATAFVPIMTQVIGLVTGLAGFLRDAVKAIQPAAPVFEVLAGFIALLALRLVVLKGISMATFFVNLVTGLWSSVAAAAASVLGIGGVTVAAEAATPAVGGLAVATNMLVWPLTLVVAAFVLLIANLNQVAQGMLVLALAFVSGVQMIVDAVALIPGPTQDAMKSVSKTLEEAKNNIKGSMRQIQDEIDKAATPIADASASTFGGITDGLNDQKAPFGKTVIELMKAFADGLRTGRKDIDSALDELTTDVKNSMTKKVEIHRLGGLLMGAELANGLHSADPLVKAQAVYTRQLILNELNALTGGAYAAGSNAASALAAGFASPGGDPGAAKMIASGSKTGPGAAALDAKAAWDKLKASFDPAGAAARLLNTDITALTGSTKSLGSATSSLRSTLGTAFDAIKTSAHDAFDKMHADHLRAITDARDLANAGLSAQASALQAPVDAARKALQDQRNAQQEAQLRSAVTTAADPAALAAAQQALNDFLAQQNIDIMQSAVDVQVKLIDVQKKSNDAKAVEDTKAENARFTLQRRNFDIELAALKKHLEEHPKEWKAMNAKVLLLLDKFGVDYHTSGSNLGDAFAAGLRSKVKAVEAAAQALAGAAAANLKVKSPTLSGPLSEDQSKWGVNLADNWLSGLRAGIGKGVAVPGLASIAGMMKPAAGNAPAAAPAAPAGGPMMGDVHIHVGTMIASEGEQRAFARTIKVRLEDELWRAGQPALGAYRGGS